MAVPALLVKLPTKPGPYSLESKILNQFPELPDPDFLSFTRRPDFSGLLKIAFVSTRSTRGQMYNIGDAVGSPFPINSPIPPGTLFAVFEWLCEQRYTHVLLKPVLESSFPWSNPGFYRTAIRSLLEHVHTLFVLVPDEGGNYFVKRILHAVIGDHECKRSNCKIAMESWFDPTNMIESMLVKRKKVLIHDGSTTVSNGSRSITIMESWNAYCKALIETSAFVVSAMELNEVNRKIELLDESRQHGFGRAFQIALHAHSDANGGIVDALKSVWIMLSNPLEWPQDGDSSVVLMTKFLRNLTEEECAAIAVIDCSPATALQPSWMPNFKRYYAGAKDLILGGAETLDKTLSPRVRTITPIALRLHINDENRVVSVHPIPNNFELSASHSRDLNKICENKGLFALSGTNPLTWLALFNLSEYKAVSRRLNESLRTCKVVLASNQTVSLSGSPDVTIQPGHILVYMGRESGSWPFDLGHAVMAVRLEDNFGRVTKVGAFSADAPLTNVPRNRVLSERGSWTVE
ncbi:hypothetical protein HDU93_003524 [Gonapodya sp. JEL0774]|nr:hypothetical protein HDU93_003524 [Gonapodya sp. JEL0774]